MSDAPLPATPPDLPTAVPPAARPLALADWDALQRDFLAAATADNTRRTYRAAVRHFLAWGGVLPADEAAVLRYLLAHATTHAVRTLTLRLTALSQWHTQQGFIDATATATVRKTLQGIGRTHGCPKKQAKALPVADLWRIVDQLSSQNTLKAQRDNALLQLGYFGAYRRSELAGLQCAQLAWEPEGLVITLPRSKTDPQGLGIVKAIPYGTAPYCPVTALRAWLAAAGIQDGAVFRSINQWQVISARALHPASINGILAECAVLAGLPYVPELSSHSLRRGMATSAYRAGADFREIKRQGGWRHDGTVQGYIEEAGRFAENAVRSLLPPKSA